MVETFNFIMVLALIIIFGPILAAIFDWTFWRKPKKAPISNSPYGLESLNSAMATLRKDLEDYKRSQSKIENAALTDQIKKISLKQEDLNELVKETSLHLREHHLKLAQETVRRINEIEYKFLQHARRENEKEPKLERQAKRKTDETGQGAERI